MHPCLSWITLSMLTAAHVAPPTAGASAASPPPARPAPASTASTPPAAPPAASPAAPTSQAESAPAPTSSAQPAAVGDPEARAEQAAALYSERKYAEAAALLEELWASVHEPRDLFNAALARVALGHRAHAIRYWETYLVQPGVPADGLEQAQARLKKAQAAAAGVSLRLAPAAVAEVGATYTLRRIAADAGDERPPLVIELPAGAPEFSAGGRTVYLDAGKWELTVEARGYRTSVQELTVKPSLAGFPKEIVLGPDPLFRHATFQIEPPEAVQAGATVTLQRLTASAEPVPCPLSQTGACALKLEPGDWEVVVQAPGFQRYTEKVSLGAQPTASFAVALVPTVVAAAPPVAAPVSPAATPAGPPAKPEKPDVVPKAVRIKLSTGLVASGIPVFIAGLALGVTGSNAYQDGRTMGNSSAELLPSLRMRSAGMGLVGAAVGLWATGLTAEYDVKPAVWYSELAVGGAFLLTGAIWSGVGTSRWNNNQVPKFSCRNSDGIDCFASHRMGSAFFLGAGTAMVVGSTLGLLIQRRYLKKQRTSLTPFFAGGAAGLVVQGRF